MQYVLIPLIISVIVFAVCMLWILKDKKKRRSGLSVETKKSKKNYFRFLTKIYEITPVLKKYYKKLMYRYRALIPADEITLTSMTTKRMTFCLIIAGSIVLVSIIICKGDIPYTVAGILAGYIIFTNLLNTSEEKLQLKILDQLDTLITETHAYYHDSEMVDEAIAATLDGLPYEISLHANKIYNIVTSTNSEMEVESYITTAPNKFLLLLAAICVSVKEYGDSVLSDGKSLFLKNLNYLKQELSEERIRIRRRVNAFTGKVIGVLIPIFCLKPIEIWANANFPDMASFYKGAGGVVSLAIIILIIFVCYECINTLKDDRKEEEEVNQIFLAIAKFPLVKRVINAQVDHNYTKSRRIADMLKIVGNKGGINVFMVKRYVYAVAIAVLTLVISISGMHRSANVLVSDFSQSYSDSLVPNENYRDTMREASEELSKRYIATSDITEETIKADLREQYDMDDDYIKMVLEELNGRADDYKNIYFKWYILLLAIVSATIGYFVPYWLLLYKKSVMVMSREDEVSQFRTLILILMHEDGMTLDTVLEWMQRFSHAFKSSISDCIFNLEYSQQKAIEKMKEAEIGFAPFRRLCDSLMAVDKVGLEGAFDDLETERDYYQDKRRLDNEILLKKCASRASKIQMIPVWAVFILYLGIPFGMMVLRMFTQFGSAF